MNPKIILQLSVLSSALLLVGAADAGHAAEAAPDDTRAADAASAADETDAEGTAGTPSSEVFIPTEEISEDFAVSFPVDI